MKTESIEPLSEMPVHGADSSVDHDLALATCLDDSLSETRRLREGGWDGRRTAIFIATLAETGVVRDACRECGMSAKSAYALRHRDPVFAQAWEAALDMARHRLADELLARSLKGSAEALLQSGAIVAERQHFDNKLAFSILRRLDRRAELGATFRTRPAWESPASAPAVSGEWQAMLDALSEDRRDDAERLLAPKDEQGNTLVTTPCSATRWTTKPTANLSSRAASGGRGRPTNGAPTSRRRPGSTATNMAIGRIPKAIRARSPPPRWRRSSLEASPSRTSKRSRSASKETKPSATPSSPP
jgi:hypothetical protein